MTTEDFDLYEDSSTSWAIRVEDEDPAETFTPIDLTGATITADIDASTGTNIAQWTVTIPAQTGEDVGWAELELSAAARSSILASGKQSVVYDVRVVTAAGEVFYPVEKSTIKIQQAVTES